VVPELPKGGINLYIEFEKHKRDQRAAKNIHVRVYLEKRIAFSKQNYGFSEEKCTRTNDTISMIRIESTYCLQTVLITARPGITIYNASKQIVHGKFRILSLESRYLET